MFKATEDYLQGDIETLIGLAKTLERQKGQPRDRQGDRFSEIEKTLMAISTTAGIALQNIHRLDFAEDAKA